VCGWQVVEKNKQGSLFLTVYASFGRTLLRTVVSRLYELSTIIANPHEYRDLYEITEQGQRPQPLGCAFHRQDDRHEFVTP
jgi:hypothetical protein